MTLDNEQQRTILMELIGAANFPGSALELIYGLKKSIESAEIQQSPKTKE